MSKILFVLSLFLSFTSLSQYSDTLSCSGGALEYVIHYDQQQCAGDCDGRYSIEILTGVGPYNYTITGPSYSHTNFEDSLLCPGSYDFQIEDVGQAITCNETISIDTLTAMTYTPGITSTSGGGACDGEAWMSVSGGVPDYTYVWFDAAQVVIPGETDSIMTNLCAGVYYVKVYDNAIGCQDSTGFVQLTVPNPPLNVIITNQWEETCPGSGDSGFDYMATGGSGNYTFVFNGNPISGSGTEWPAGDGTLEVWDDAGGYATAFVFFTGWPPIEVYPMATNETCGGSCDGSIYLDDTWSWVTGYSIDGGLTWQSSQTFNNLCPGTYHTYCSVPDSWGSGACTIELGFHDVLAGGPNPLAVTETVTNNTCNTACYGEGQLAITGTTGTPIILWEDDLGNPIGSLDTIANLCAGVYYYTITDPGGCVYSDSILITEPAPLPPLSYNIITYDESAPGACDGMGIIQISGGATPYTIQWYDASQIPIPLETNDTLYNACVGLYYVSYTDSSPACCDTCTGGTSSTLIPVIINSPIFLTNDGGVYGACAFQCNITGTWTATGGSGNYTYTMGGQSNTDGIFGGLCPPGNYTVTVTDDFGNSTASTLIIPALPPASTYATPTDETCLGACDGVITFTDPLFEAEFFSLDAITWTTNPVFPGLCSGTYDLYIQTWDVCSVNIGQSTVQPGTGLTIDQVYTSPLASCIDSVDISGGPAVSYTLDGAPITIPSCGLAIGTYTLCAYDASGCSSCVPVTISQCQISATEVVDDNTCLSDCNGNSQLTVLGTVGPYTVEWFDDLGTSIELADSIDSLCGGVYDYTITDSTGCTFSDSILILDPPIVPPMSYTLTTTNVTATGLCDGTATISITGGLPPYSITWYDSNQVPIPNENGPTIDSLCIGQYYVSFDDSQSGGCGAGSGSGGLIPFSIFDPLSISLVFEQFETCPWMCDAGLIFQAFGGDGNYTIDLNGMVDPNGEFWGLCPGIYTATVTDGQGNVASTQWEIFEILPPSVTVISTNETCVGACDGSIDFQDPFFEAMQYSIDGGMSWFPTNGFSGLCPGNYDCWIMTWSGCIVWVDFVTISAGSPFNPSVTVNVTNENCLGACDGTITINDPLSEVTNFSIGGMYGPSNTFTGLCPGSYDIWLQNATGCEVQYSTEVILGGASITIDSVETTPVGVGAGGCLDFISITGGVHPFTYTIDGSPLPAIPACGLSAGTYTLCVTDAAGCSDCFVFTIESCQLTAIDNSLMNSCYGACDGFVEVIPSGQIGPATITWTDGAGGNIGSGTSVSGLCEDNYFYSIVDSAGCSLNGVLIITEPDSISISIQINALGCNYPCNNDLTVGATGGTGAYEYSLDGITWYSSSDFNGLCPGIHTVYVRDANGCINTLTFEIVGFQSLTVSTDVNNEFSDDTNCTGDISATVIGGKAPFNYEWKDCETDATMDLTNNPTDLCPGEYYVVATDANGCSVTSAPCDTIHSTAGYDFLDLDLWSIYPNPASSTVTVEGINSGDFTVSVMDSRGRVILEKSSNSTELVIDLKANDVVPGSYLVKIEQGSIIAHKRLIIQ